MLLVTVTVGWYARCRPNASYPAVHTPAIETWTAVADGRHNSNTDLIHWHGAFWLAHARAPWHFASTTTRIVLRRSLDARSWQEVTRFACPDEDVRDPKFAVIRGRLWLYWLPNRHFPEAQPRTTVVTSSPDGFHWDAPIEMRPPGWLMWRPRTRDGSTHYAAAYWHEHGEAALFRSTDGREWEKVSTIVRGRNANETDIVFLADDRLLAVSRVEGDAHDAWFGDAGGATVISVASPPYAEWTRVDDRRARLDGPCLFAWNGQVFAIARYEPATRGGLFETGSVLSRKRTALYEVTSTGARLLALLPSAGDTSYAGVALREGRLFASYYTSRVDRDYPWILGMLSRSDIRMASLPLAALDGLVARREE